MNFRKKIKLETNIGNICRKGSSNKVSTTVTNTTKQEYVSTVCTRAKDEFLQLRGSWQMKQIIGANLPLYLTFASTWFSLFQYFLRLNIKFTVLIAIKRDQYIITYTWYLLCFTENNYSYQLDIARGDHMRKCIVNVVNFLNTEFEFVFESAWE